MSDYITNDTELTSIADAIRTKGGTSASLVYPSGFISAINAIPTGSSIDVEALTITQNGIYTAPTGTAYSPVTVSVPSSAPNLSSLTVTPTESQQAFTPATGFDGYNSVTVNAISSTYVGSAIPRRDVGDVTASRLTVTIPSGYYSIATIKNAAPMMITATVIPSESEQTETPPSGYDGFSKFTVEAISSTYVGSSVPRKSSADLTASGSTVTVPSGFYSMQATKNIGAGVAGTPTNIAGMVTNHSITITPTVTNDAGYISGGTKTGTATIISASQLVSGDLPITSNGTGIDVTNYETVSVNVQSPGVSFDTKTVTASNYPTSLSFSSMKGSPKFLALRLNAQVSSSGNTTYYYIVDIVSNGTTTHGNCFRVGGTRRVENITSGYSWSYSASTLTLTTTASGRSASPGAFYNASYELMYAY